MKPLNCIWFEDKAEYATNLEKLTIIPLCEELNIGFMGVRFDDAGGLSEFSKGIYIDLVLVDHNLIGEVTGDEIIKEIRKHDHNKTTPIIYYSSNTQVIELQELVKSYPDIVVIHRNDLPSYCIRLLRQF